MNTYQIISLDEFADLASSATRQQSTHIPGGDASIHHLQTSDGTTKTIITVGDQVISTI